MNQHDAADAVEARVQSIREAVLGRNGVIDGADVPPAVESQLEEAARLARINAHWGITSELPLIGPLVVLVRRSIRIGLRWYINPLAEQQTRFNEAVVRALYQIEGEVETLRREQEAGTTPDDSPTV